MRSSIVLVVCCVLVASACGGSATPTTSAPSSSAAAVAPAAAAPAPASPTRLTIAYGTASASITYLQLGQDRNVFRDNGLEVEIVHAPGNAAPAAVVSGQAQFMATGCAEILGAIGAGTDFVFLSTTTNRLEYALAGGPSLPDRASVRGKRLGVSRLGTSSHLATKLIVQQLGLDPDQDVTYVQVGNTPERMAALLTGSVDGAVLSVEESSLVGNQPGPRIVVDMTNESFPYCGNSMVATRQYVRENPEVVRRLMKALVETIARYKLNKAEAMEAIGSFLQEQDPQKLEHTWTLRERLIPAKPYPDPDGLRFVVDQLGQQDERIRALTPEALADPSWIRQLDESGYIDSLYRPAGAR